jgi:transposase
LAVLRARDELVQARTKLINHIRGAVKSVGERIPKMSAEAFGLKVPAAIPEGLGSALGPLVLPLRSLTDQIRQHDKWIEKVAVERYPQSGRLRQVAGVGPLTSTAYVLTLEDPRRFALSRDVGAYLGLCPKRAQSGESDPQLRISKAGNSFLRRLLVGSAQYILGPFGPDTDLRRFGKKLAQRGGKNAKKRAVVGVTRKLSVLLHRLWLTGETYDPLRNAKRNKSKASAEVRSKRVHPGFTAPPRIGLTAAGR